MIFNNWLIVNKNGINGVRKTKPSLKYNEIAIRIKLDIPKEFFERPTIEATLKVDGIPNNVYKPDLILNTKDLIEQQTGAKIEFKILPTQEVENE
jgi:hypothetical protein